jgi:hypothetical protein
MVLQKQPMVAELNLMDIAHMGSHRGCLNWG